MNVAETLLVFAGAPLAIVAVLALLIYVPGGRRRPRYKSGQPWTYAPVWYEPHPEHGPDAGHGSGETMAIGSSVYGERHGDAAEQTHGSSLDGRGGSAPTPHAAVSAGPLGGARGTW